MAPYVAPNTLEPALIEPKPTRNAKHYLPLFELQKKRQLLEVVHNQDSYQSIILRTDIAKGILILDDLFSVTSSYSIGTHPPINVGDELIVKHHHSNGKVLSFTSPLLDIDLSPNSPLYVLKLPNNLDCGQRRRLPRVLLGQKQPLGVKLQSDLNEYWFATAHNLSSGGMRLVLGGNLVNQLQRGSILPLCEFHFNSYFHIRCQAAVRSFRFLRSPYRQTQISVEFINIASYQRLQLQQFINAMQNASKQAA